MKMFAALCIGCLLLTSCMDKNARDTALRYKFSADTTNVFAVEISVRSELGSEFMTGKVILATARVTTNSATIACRANMIVESTHAARGPGFFLGYYPGGLNQHPTIFPNACRIELNDQGVELRDGGDYVLAAPLGKLVQSLFEPLPAKSSNSDTRDIVTVLDDPFWLGPADNFLNATMNGDPLARRGGMSYPQPVPTTLTVSRQISISTKGSTNDLVQLHKRMTLQSFLLNGPEPRLVASSESDFVFDRNTGLLSEIETRGSVSSQTETSARTAKVVFKARLLVGAERETALKPPLSPASAIPALASAQRQTKVSGADLEKISAGLQSADITTRRAASDRLQGTEFDVPSAEFLRLVAATALDSDAATRIPAQNFIGSYATTNEFPLLLQMLKDPDWNSSRNAIRAFGRLKDERAIQPLADFIVRGGSSGQNASYALISIGKPAEKAVIVLLNERNIETQRQACNILRQIGTSESLDALQTLVRDGELSTSQAATDAIRAIKQRQ